MDALDLLGGDAPVSRAPAPAPAAEPAQEAYAKHGVRIAFRVQRTDTQVQLQAHFTADAPVSALAFQAAVPKSQKLQMSPISSTSIAPGADATQTMHVSGAIQGPVRLRVRVSFTTASGEAIKDQFDWAQRS